MYDEEEAMSTVKVPTHEAALCGRIGKVGGFAALLYGLSLLYLLALLTIVIPSSGLTSEGQHDPAQVLPWLRAHQELFALLWLPEFLASFLLIVVVLALNDRLRALAPGRMRVASACGLLGIFLLVSHTLVQNAMIPLAHVHVQDRVGAESAFRASDAIAGWLTLGGLFAIGLWIVVVSWSALQAGGFPRRAAYTGLVAGLITLLALFLGVPPGILGLLLWNFSLAVVLPRGSSAAVPTHVAVAPA
jgi:hypothetical protein